MSDALDHPTLADLKRISDSSSVALVFSLDSDVAAVGCRLEKRKGNQVRRLSPQTAGFLYATVDRGKTRIASRALLHRNAFLRIQRSGCSLGLCTCSGLVVAHM